MPNMHVQHRNFNVRRVLFDTNILMDIIDARRPSSTAARRALEICNGGGDMGVVAPLSLKDAYYLLTRQFGEPNARTCIEHLVEQLVVIPFGAEECLIAVDSNEPDFEDGLIRAAAELNDIDFILTRDASAFRRSTVRAITCEEYLDIVESENRAIERLKDHETLP